MNDNGQPSSAAAPAPEPAVTQTPLHPTPFFMLPDDIARRAFLPEVMLIEDVALALSVSRAAAQRLVSSGKCGPYSRIGRRLTIRREAFLEALRKRETWIDGRDRPRRKSPAVERIEELLRRPLRRRRHQW